MAELVAELNVSTASSHTGDFLTLTIHAASKAMRKPAHLTHYTVSCSGCGWREQVANRADGRAVASRHADTAYRVTLDC